MTKITPWSYLEFPKYLTLNLENYLSAAEAQARYILQEFESELPPEAKDVPFPDGSRSQLAAQLNAAAAQTRSAVQHRESERAAMHAVTVVLLWMRLDEDFKISPDENQKAEIPSESNWTNNKSRTASNMMKIYINGMVHSPGKEIVRIWMRDRFPDLPGRQFERLWSDNAPEAWKRPGKKPLRTR